MLEDTKMQGKSWLFELVCSLLMLTSGCHTHEQEPSGEDGLLEDLFKMEYMGLESHGMKHYVQYVLKDGVDKEHAVREIGAYLRGEPGARRTELDKGWLGFVNANAEGYRIHVRDFWALVLADLRGVKVDITAGPPSPHEREIAKLLESLGMP